MLWQHRELEETTWERKDMMRATYPFLFKDEGMWFSRLVIKCLVCMHVIVYDCLCMRLHASVREFRDEILLRGEECKTQENFNFSEK